MSEGNYPDPYLYPIIEDKAHVTTGCYTKKLLQQQQQQQPSALGWE